MQIRALTADTASQWYRSIRAAPGDMDRLNDVLQAGPLAPHLRLVALGGAGVCGRFGAQLREAGISFWIPLFRADVPPAERREAMRLFIEALLAHRSAAGLGHVPLETEPGDDQPDNAAWLDVLRQAGFVEACVYRLYVLAEAGFAAARPAVSGLAVHAIEPGDLLKVGTLFQQAYADTSERRERRLDAPAAYIEELRGIGEGYEPGLWLMALIGGQPAAFALVNRARDLAFSGMSAWLLEVGCLPSYRHRGIARALLSEITLRLKECECERLLSTIDDANAPSIHLHEALGFAVQPEQFYVYRRTA